MFGLDIEKVVAILAKMILKNELNASIDRTTMLVYLDDQPSTSVMSRIDYLAGIYSDKLNGLIDSNEKLLEAKCVQLGLAEAVVAPHRPRTKKAH